jgi:acyl-CoA thioester hydrolase
MSRPQPSERGDFAAFATLTTRWADNDVYGHMNNVVHYQLFDTAVNGHLIREGVLDPAAGQAVFLVVETACSYHAEIAFPDVVTAGIRVTRLGRSSVTYAIGLFRNDAMTAAAEGRFTHVLVDRESRRPLEIEGDTRRVLEALQLQEG